MGRIAASLILVSALSCEKNGPVTAARRQLPLAVEECDPAGYIACARNAAIISIPITNTGLSLSYSSDARVGGGGSATDVVGLGLGGWSINAVHRYDPKSGVLFQGDGTWRSVRALSLPSGEHAIPSYDAAVAYVFDSAWHHIRTVDGHLGSVLLRMAYDAAGHLDRVDGSVADEPVHLSVQRRSDGIPLSLVGADGGTTMLDLDGTGRLSQITDPADGKTLVRWGSNGRVVSVTDPLGGVTRYTYDGANDLASMTDADSVVTQFERKDLADGFELRVSTALGRHWLYRAEAVGAAIRRTAIGPDGLTNAEAIDPNGARTLTMPDGTVFTIGALAGPAWGMTAPVLTPIVEKRSDGVVSRREEKDSLQPQHGVPYAVTGSITTTINGHAWIQTFDPDARVTTLTDPMGRRTTSTYDAAGHTLRQSAPGTPTVSFVYGGEGRLASQTVGVGPLAQTTDYKYDPSTGQILTTRADRTVESTHFDRAGRTVSTSAGDGSMTLAMHNAAGRLTLLMPPAGVAFVLGTSLAGRPTAFVPPATAIDSSVEITSYDRDGAVAAVSGLGNRAVHVVRDRARRLIGLTFNEGSRAFSYDPHSGFVAQASDPSGVTITYGYAGNTLSRLAWSGPVTGSVVDSLDADGRIAAELVDATSAVRFTYDASGDLTSVGPLSFVRDPTSGLVTRTAIGGVQTSEQYDANARLIQVTTVVAGKPLLEQRYTRDALDRVTGVTETANGTTVTTAYSYDRAGRLATVRINGRLVETNVYDNAGNRTSVARPDGTIRATYDARDQALSWGTLRYSWASDGSLQRQTDGRRTVSLSYDDFGALRGATLPDGGVITYLIDAEGRRIGRAVAGRLVAGYLYRADGLIAAEIDSAGAVIGRFAYDDDGHIALVERGGVVYRVVTDAIGSPRLVIESRSGTVADDIAYDAWGTVTRETTPGFLPIGFAGGLRDRSTGLLRFGSRDYDPVTGRWTAADPMRFDAGDANLYRYAASDPINNVDPTGLKGGGKGGNNPPPTPKPPSTGNPPNPGNPPNSGNPPTPPPNPSPGGTWRCDSPNGGCGGPGRGNPWGCTMGSCGSNNNHFWCKAQLCQGPGGDLCIAPAGSQCSWGEPHFRTGGASLDFQASGEFLAATSPDGKFAVQVRQQPLSAGAQVALNSAVAANVNGDRIGVYTKEPAFLMINGAPVNAEDFEGRLPHGGTISRHGATLNVEWPDGSRLTVIRTGAMLNYGILPSAGIAPAVRGLLPNADSSRWHALISRDGASLGFADPAFSTKLYQQFGKSWRIKQSESLFHYWPGESTATFTDPSFPTKPVSADSLSPATRARAESICRAVGVQTEPTLDACILDVGVTGTPAMAAASVAAGGTSPLSVATAVQVSAAPSPVVPSSSGPDAYAIKIGDTVSPDRPGPGAGVIARPGQRQTYTFEGRAGDIIYVQVSPCQDKSVAFDLRDPTNRNVGGRIGCGDFGPISLAAAGVYRLAVTSDHDTARYTFTLHAVTFDTYAIKIGDTVSPNRPAVGAGIIAQPGERQSYSFGARSGDIIYVQAGRCEGPSITFDVVDRSKKYVGGKIGCGDFGPITLPATGTYQILVRSEPSTVRFTFVLRATTFDRYAINIGDSVSPDHPVSGAGIISKLGERQSYAVQAKARQTVYLGIGPCQGTYLTMDIFAPDDKLAGTKFGCDDRGRTQFATAGTYHLVFRTDSTVRYAFFLHPIPPDQHFDVRLPATVSPDVPIRGTGRIAAQGGAQLYDFSAPAGMVVHLEGNCSSPCPKLRARIARVGDSTDAGFGDLTIMKADWPLPPGNRYTVEVRSAGYVGSYGFKASIAAPKRP